MGNSGLASNPTSAPAANGTPNGAGLSERVRSLRLPEGVNQGRLARNPWPWILCGLCVLAMAFMALRDRAAPAEPARTANSPGTATTPAQRKEAPGRDDDIALEAKGYIIPASLIQVSPKVGGMVMELFIEENKKVKKGDILAHLEDTEYLADRNRVRAQVQAARQRWEELWKYRPQEVRQAKADLDEARANLDQAEQEWRRSLNLKKINALAPRELEQAESSFKSQKSRVERLELTLTLLEKGPRDHRIESAKAELDQWEAELVKAQWKLDNCTVRAPVSGVILTKKAEQGNMVNPAAYSNGLSASLCEMADLKRLEVELAIAERDIAKVFPGQVCKIRSEAFPDRPYEGVVSRLMPIADRAKGAVPVRVAILIPAEEEGQYLRPEMGAIVNFYRKK